MLLIVLLLTIFTVAFAGITTIPFAIGLLAVCTAILKKAWVFILAFGIGLFLDLTMIRTLGQTSLILTTFVFLLFLYERKFETRTIAFVSISTFLGSLIYLIIFNYQQIILQSLANSLIAVIFFKFLWLKLGPRSETI